MSNSISSTLSANYFLRFPWRSRNLLQALISSMKLKFILCLVVSLIAITSQAQTVEIAKSVSNPLPPAGTTVAYTLNFRCASTTSNCENVVITDVVSTNLTFSGATSSLGGNPMYDPNSNTLTVSFNRGGGAGLNAGDAGQVVITCIVPSNTPSGTNISNTGAIASSNAGTKFSSVALTTTGGATFVDGVGVSKFGSGNFSPGGSTDFTVNHGNTGSGTLTNYSVTDPLPTGLSYQSIRIVKFPGTNNNISLFYKTNNNPSYQAWTGNPKGTTGDDFIVNVNELNLAGGEVVTEVRFDYGDLPGGGLFFPNLPNAYGNIIITAKAATDVTAPSLENCATASGGGFSKTACATSFNNPPEDKGFAFKSLAMPSPFAAGTDVGFFTGITFPASNVTPITEVTIVDLMPPGASYVAGSATTTFASNPTLVQTIIPNFNNTGRTLLRFKYSGFTIPADGMEHIFGVNFKINHTQGGNAIRNILYASPNIPLQTVNNPFLDTDDLDGDGNTTENLACDFREYTITGNVAAAGLESFKLVKGQLDADYSRFPASGNTTAGGNADYRLVVRNPNTVPMTNIKIVDILPFIGDRGVIDLSLRNSEWQPNLAGPVSVPAGVTVYYSTANNPCRDEVKQPSDPSPFPSGCTPPNWSTTPPPDITDVRSLKFDFGTLVLNQNDQVELNWPMRAPVNAPANGEIAWNSFGFSSTRADNNQDLLPSEPIKVGIKLEPIKPAVIGDLVWIDTNQDGIKDANESGVDGVRVTLYRADGSVAGFTVTANGGLYLFPNLAPGDYYVIFSNLPAGFVASPPNQGGNPANDSDGIDIGGGSYKTVTTNLIATEDDRTWDFGIYLPAPCINPTAGTPVATQATCKADGIVNGDAKIDISGINNATVYAFTTDGSTPSFSGATAVSGGAVNLANIANPSSAVTYKFRFFNGSETCFTDVSVNLEPKTGCVPACTPPTPVGQGTTVCAGSSATLTATGCDATYTLKWYSDAGLSNEITSGTSGNNLTTNALTATADYYAACVKDANCKSAGTKITVTVVPKPTADATITQATCNTAGTAANNDAKIVISNITNGATYTVDGGASQPISGNAITLDNLPNPAATKNYTVKIFNSAASDCFNEILFTLEPKICVPSCTNPTVGAPAATQATCKADGTVNGDAKIDISGINNATVYAFTTDGSAPNFASAIALSGGVVGLSNIANPSTAITYKFRFFNGSADCFTDITTILNPKTDCASPLGSIGDKVFVDANKDGKQDASEMGVDGVTVNLLDASGATIATTTTAGGGKYLFPNLPAGTYSVEFVKTTIPAIYSGFTSKDTTGVSEALNSDADKITGKTEQVILAPVLNPTTAADSAATFNFTLDAGVLQKPDPNCVTTPPTSVVGPNVFVCKGSPYTTLKAMVMGTGTVDWYKTAMGGAAVATGTLEYTPTGNVVANDTFYLASRSTLPNSANCPAVTERTQLIVMAQNCADTVDLALRKLIDKKQAKVGDIITYTIKVWNQSNKKATGVEVADSLSAGVQYQSSTATRGSYNPSTKAWTIGEIAANGDTVTLTMQVKVLMQGVWFNTAQISKTNEKDNDSTPGNNQDAEDDIERQCFTVPLEICNNQGVSVTVPSPAVVTAWYKQDRPGDAPVLQPNLTGNTVTLDAVGIYTFTANSGSCPASGCCPVIVEAINCCPADLCIPFVIKSTKKAGKPVK